ncbi:zinc-dependent peptidase [Nitrogeniibacter mangrovi]|uniref:Zinc-dependent peptidase n=2 Tax=Nitrogeniibacter mangrovi TaxID=2016596 RepID=A0A6C1B4M9_9RHOO|nr:zinc-dependent peptidase [Nitrogeniibacter mangrovi]
MFAALRRWLSRTPDARDDDIPAALWARVEAGLPCLHGLPAETRARLRDLARRFLAEKEFHGARGMVLSDEIMLSIALQACLPILRVGLEGYRHWVGIVVYPGDFVVDREVMDEDGVVHNDHHTLLGEAWDGGPVIVSWAPAGGPAGVNVVIHEFAHTLDMLNGAADGFPPLPADMNRHAWAQAFEAAYEDLCARVDHGMPTVLDPYASEHPAEFFAVASEAFFERPDALRDTYPAVYAQLGALFGVDPSSSSVASTTP